MSDTKAVNNQRDTDRQRVTELEAEVERLTGQSNTVIAADIVEQLAAGKSAAEHEARDYRAKFLKASAETADLRRECRDLITQASVSQTVEETLARRVAAHRRDLVPGDRIAAAALIECEAVLAIIRNIKGARDANPS